MQRLILSGGSKVKIRCTFWADSETILGSPPVQLATGSLLSLLCGGREQKYIAT